jgi:hypothetical protein|nr:MAG TPA: hypothetical protein [Caudoviricetes sp.]
MLNKKEMVKEIANLIINRVDFSEIDFTKQKVRVTNLGNYEIFKGYQTDDLADAQLKRAIYDVAQPIVDFDFTGEIEEILEMHGYFDYIEKDEMRDFPKEFYYEIVNEIYNDERFSEQIDWCVFDY